MDSNMKLKILVLFANFAEASTKQNINGTVNMLYITTIEKIYSQIITLFHSLFSKYQGRVSFLASDSSSSSAVTTEAFFCIFLMYSSSTSSYNLVIVFLRATYIRTLDQSYRILSFFSSGVIKVKSLPRMLLLLSNCLKSTLLIIYLISSTCSSFEMPSAVLISCSPGVRTRDYG